MIWENGGLRAEIHEGTAADARLLKPYYSGLVGDAAPWFPIPRSAERLDPWLARSGIADFERNLHWIAVAGERMVGHLFFQRMDIPTIGLEGVCSGNVTVDPEYREAGLGAALMGIWSPVATDRLRAAGVRRIVAHIFPENGPSRRLASRVGLEFEGMLRQHMRGADGKFHDMIVMGQILSDGEACERCVASREGAAETHLRRVSACL